MYVDFNDLPNTARIWVYQADRELNSTQVEEMQKALKDFIEDWTRHGEDLKGSFAIL